MVCGLKEIGQLARLTEPPLKMVIVAGDLESFNGPHNYYVDTVINQPPFTDTPCELNILQHDLEHICQLKTIPFIRASKRKKLR